MQSPISMSHTEHLRTPTIASALPPRCTQCNARRKENLNGRNLVVCIDGTSNQFGHNNTNVVKLFAKIDLETTRPEQFAYYSSGIGTRPKSLHILSRMERAITDKFDMAVAWNMEEIVKDAYGWLARMYQEGDQIYLFGFSRGAYQVRVLAGMIHEVGLIRTHTDKQIGTAYDHYESIRSGKPKTRQIAREFKTTFSWKDLRVHFVGVWDTVSSVGLIRGDVFLSTSSSAAHACHFRHALALDELRVKFMPEYFREMNTRTDNGKSKYIVTEHATTPTGERREPTVSDDGTDLSGVKNRTTEIKEVWFAGSHSDVGGKNIPGKSYQAGNVSLLWMRREAAASGLVLDPTDIVWVPDDIDFGTSDSMSGPWRFIEYIPIKHQVSFTGSGEYDNNRRRHLRQPRRIIPGQKVHASILYANAYKPQATLGEGFDISILRDGLGTEPDGDIWETGLFDDTAAQELVQYLGGQQGVAPIYLDRLLFMLRFKEGKKCVRAVPDWQGQFKRLINNSYCASLVRLVALVAYYEASCDPEAPEGTVPLAGELPQNVFDDVVHSLSSILSLHKHRDGPRVVALLRPLTNHKILREKILTKDVLDTLVNLLDSIISQGGGNFGQAMDGLNCLLDCDHTQKIIIVKLGENHPESNVSRLSRILEINKTPLLTAALRMVMTLAGIQEGKRVCINVKPRLRELARKNDRLVGLLAVEILLALYDPNEQERQLNLRDSRVRANLASALTRLNPDNHDSTDPGQQILRKLFGLDDPRLDATHKRLIGALEEAVQTGNTRERTGATLTLLKLCETDTVRAHLLENELLDIFVNQLRRKDSALLAAYALTTCMKHGDMKISMMKKEDLAKNIVNMLRRDYFDDAVGQVEGFQIFGDFMQQKELREKIKKYDITKVLSTKLEKDESKETRTSLICLDIFRSFDHNGPWTKELVDKSLESLKKSEWKAQKAGVMILSALVQTDHGVVAIHPRMHEIIEMLLPSGYLPIPPSTGGVNPTSPTLPGQVQPLPVATTTTVPVDSNSPTDVPSRPPPCMMGPTCALRILAQNKELRNRTRESIQYASLKHLYLSGTLLDETDTSPWRVRTPNRADITNMLDKMIEAVDGELSEGGVVPIGDTVLPHIQHWDILLTMLRNRTVAVVTILPALLGVSVLGILGVILVAPVYLSVRVFDFLKRKGSYYLDGHILDRLHLPHMHGDQSEHARETDPGVHGSEAGPGGHVSESAPSGPVGLLQRVGSRYRDSQIFERLSRPSHDASPSEHAGEAGSSGHGGFLQRVRSRYRDSQILPRLRGHGTSPSEHEEEGHSDVHGGEAGPSGHGGEDAPGEHGSEGSQGGDNMGVQGGREVGRTASSSNP